MKKAKVKRNANVVHRVIIFLIWVFIVISDCYCLSRNVMTDNAFIVIFDVMAFIMWCMLCKKERKCTNVVCAVKKISKSSKSSRLPFTICISLILVIILMPVMITLHDSVFPLETERCRDMWNFSSNKKLQVVLIVTQQTLRQLLVHGLFYFVTAFFCYICAELNYPVKCLIDDINPRHWSDDNINALYSDIIKALQAIEEAMCSSISVVLAIGFAIFFRVVVAFLFHPIFQSKPYLVLSIATYMLGSFISFISVVVSADKLQNDIRKLRRMKLDSYYPLRDNSYSFDDVAEEFLSLMEDKGNIVLTAWKTFHIQRGLLVTAAVSVISYSVILGQLEQLTLKKKSASGI